MSLDRDPGWGNARMFVAFDPETDEILVSGRSLGKSATGPGVAQRAADLDRPYVIHQFTRIRGGNGNGGQS